MNERNIAALVEIIRDIGIGPQHESWIQATAKMLADAGVLVPNTLTRQQAHVSVQGAGLFDVEHDGAGFAARLALGLEKAARGEI